MPEAADDPALTNIVFAALNGAQRDLATRFGHAVRYQRDIAPFHGIPDDPTDADWADLETLAAGRPILIFRPAIALGPDWQQSERFPCHQMLAPDRIPAPDVPIVRLGPADVPEMTDLIRLTNPGPFRDRTITMGQYLGVRVDGRLVAIAGERMATDRSVEISAVCTHPDHRGRGYSRALVSALNRDIRARGLWGFLHVVVTNPAVAAYQAMAFTTIRQSDAIVILPPGVAQDGGSGSGIGQ